LKRLLKAVRECPKTAEELAAKMKEEARVEKVKKK
jgi:hypothetical protein